MLEGCKNNKLFFNKLLIKPESRAYFDLLYTKDFKCIICKDVLFDPVLCSECKRVYCSSCIKDKDLNNLTSNHNMILKCNHDRIEIDIGVVKEEFMKIKLNCFFKCESIKLNLFNYPGHLKKCCFYRDINNIKYII